MTSATLKENIRVGAKHPPLTKGEYNMKLYIDYLAQEELDNRLMAEWEAEQASEALEDALRADLEYAANIGDWDLYSDLYKDLYGVRPRW